MNLLINIAAIAAFIIWGASITILLYIVWEQLKLDRGMK